MNNRLNVVDFAKEIYQGHHIMLHDGYVSLSNLQVETPNIVTMTGEVHIVYTTDDMDVFDYILPDNFNMQSSVSGKIEIHIKKQDNGKIMTTIIPVGDLTIDGLSLKTNIPWRTGSKNVSFSSDWSVDRKDYMNEFDGAMYTNNVLTYGIFADVLGEIPKMGRILQDTKELLQTTITNNIGKPKKTDHIKSTLSITGGHSFGSVSYREWDVNLQNGKEIGFVVVILELTKEMGKDDILLKVECKGIMSDYVEFGEVVFEGAYSKNTTTEAINKCVSLMKQQ